MNDTESRPKHTPYPWVVRGKGGMHDGGSNRQHPCFRGDVYSADSKIVSFGSFLGVQGATPEEAEANAHLIGAAPGLLVVARQSYRDLEWYRSEVLLGHSPENHWRKREEERWDSLRLAIAKAEHREV